MGQGPLSSSYIEHPPAPLPIAGIGLGLGIWLGLTLAFRARGGEGLGRVSTPYFFENFIELLRKSVLAPHFESVVSATSPPTPPPPHPLLSPIFEVAPQSLALGKGTKFGLWFCQLLYSLI